MEIINNKGKILGIINIIDLIVLIMVVLMGFIFYKYVIMLNWEKYDFGELAYENVERIITIEMLISQDNTTIIKSIVPGAKEIYRKQIIGVIIDKQLIELRSDETNLTTLVVKIQSNLTKVDNDLYYGINNPPGQIVKVGNKFIFNSEKIKLEGKVIEIE